MKRPRTRKQDQVKRADVWASVAKLLAGKVYDDGFAPSVKALGGTLVPPAKALGETLGRLVSLGLRPLNLFAHAGEWVMLRVEHKLGGEFNLRLPPPATTDVEVRKMLEDLLIATVSADTMSRMYPPSAAEIAQLAPGLWRRWFPEGSDLDPVARVSSST